MVCTAPICYLCVVHVYVCVCGGGSGMYIIFCEGGGFEVWCLSLGWFGLRWVVEVYDGLFNF